MSQPYNVVSQNYLDQQAFAPGGHHRSTAWKKEWQEAAFWSWKQHRTTSPFAELTGRPCHVMLELAFRQNRKRDPHNYVSTVTKWAIDGLVLAGLWPDDNPEYVTVYEPKFVVYRGLAESAPLEAAVLLNARETDA